MHTTTDESGSRPTSMKSANSPTTIELPKWGLTAQIHTSIDDIQDTWDRLVVDESFAQGKYLKTLELTNPAHLKHLYVLMYKDQKEVGAVLLQSLVLKMSESFDYENYTTDSSLWSRIWQRIRQFFISMVTFR